MSQLTFSLRGLPGQRFFIERSTYPTLRQPKLLLVAYGPPQPKLLLTYELSGLDLRSYDADFGFKRRHALFRDTGPFSGDLFQELVRFNIVKLTPYRYADGPVSARIAVYDTRYVVPQSRSSTSESTLP